jgi:hypothetical protein
MLIKVPQLTTLLTCMREFHGSNLGREIDYTEVFHCYPQSLQGISQI